MSEPAPEIKHTEKSKELAPTLQQAFTDLAFKQADEFIGAGQSAREAGSIVAHMLIQSAWIVAACGVKADGGTPDKDRFRAACEAALEHIQFKEPRP